MSAHSMERYTAAEASILITDVPCSGPPRVLLPEKTSQVQQGPRLYEGLGSTKHYVELLASCAPLARTAGASLGLHYCR